MRGVSLDSAGTASPRAKALLFLRLEKSAQGNGESDGRLHCTSAASHSLIIILAAHAATILFLWVS